MSKVDFLKGLQTSYEGLATKDSNSIYITTDEGNIYLGSKKLCDFGKTIKSVTPTIASNKLTLAITFADNTTDTITLVEAINGVNTLATIDSDGKIKVDMPLSTTTKNILVSTPSGVYASIKPIYEGGELKFQSFDGTNWVDIPDAKVDLPLESFLAYAVFVKDYADWQAKAPSQYQSLVESGDITEASIVFIVEETGGTNKAIIVPSAELVNTYTFTNGTSETIQFNVSETSNAVTVNGEVKISNASGNALVVKPTSDSNPGLFVQTPQTITTKSNNTVTLTNTNGELEATVKLSETDGNYLTISSESGKEGLYAPQPEIITTANTDTLTLAKNGSGVISGNVKLKPTGGLTSDSEGIAAKISNTPNNNLIIDTNGLYAVPTTVDTTATVTLTKTLNEITATVNISNEADNILEAKTDGIYVQPMQWGTFD